MDDPSDAHSNLVSIESCKWVVTGEAVRMGCGRGYS